MFRVDVDSFLKNHIVSFRFRHLFDRTVGTFHHDLLLFVFTRIQVFLEFTTLTLELAVLVNQLLLSRCALGCLLYTSDAADE